MSGRVSSSSLAPLASFALLFGGGFRGCVGDDTVAVIARPDAATECSGAADCPPGGCAAATCFVGRCYYVEAVDADGDGFVSSACPAGDDCNDSDASIHPGSDEACDTVDQDCDASVDEGAAPRVARVPFAVGGSALTATTISGRVWVVDGEYTPRALYLRPVHADGTVGFAEELMPKQAPVVAAAAASEYDRAIFAFVRGDGERPTSVVVQAVDVGSGTEWIPAEAVEYMFVAPGDATTEPPNTPNEDRVAATLIDGHAIVAWRSSTGLWVWSPAWEQVVRLEPARNLALARAGANLAVLSGEDQLTFLSPVSGEILARHGTASQPSGRPIVAAHDAAWLFITRGGSFAQRFTLDGSDDAIATTPLGDLLFASRTASHVVVWSAENLAASIALYDPDDLSERTIALAAPPSPVGRHWDIVESENRIFLFGKGAESSELAILGCYQ